MRVAVLGSWHLGSVTAACLAAAGHQVTVWDGDATRMAGLAEGSAPVAEPGLNDLLRAGLASGSLIVEPDLAQALTGAELVWITQDTHVNDDDTVDLTDLDQLVLTLAPLLPDGVAVAVSSQVPVGTGQRWWNQLHATAESQGRSITGLAYLPENLRLGAAVARFNKPDMLVIGSTDDVTGDRLQQLTAFTSAPVIRTDVATAELVKHAINSFLATSISFANEIASVAELVGADAATVAQAMRLDERIGPKARVFPGLAFAGGTLARDVTTLIGIKAAAGSQARIAQAVIEVNREHGFWPVGHLEQQLDLAGSTVCIFGLAYTVGTSTLRRSLSVPLIKALLARGAKIRAHDPEADLTELSETLDMVRAYSPQAAAQGSDAIVLLTPWPIYLDLDWAEIAEHMSGDLVLDGPNSLDRAALQAAGLRVISPGRPISVGTIS
jgi:UDPglucose 6-dehydrogenase